LTRSIPHGLRPMAGRDPHDVHRVATSLELLFDLTFVIAFSVAGSQFAHLIAEGHYRAGLIGFGFAMFAVVWAWINFTWFASAYDTDDWIYRVTTMVQMVGVVILSLGLPATFASIDSNTEFNNMAIVIGYVIMRVPMVSQWLRAARQDPARRQICHTYAITITISQIGWVLLIFVDTSPTVSLLLALPLIVIELAGPMFAERIDAGTPWHPHHIAERYGLLAIIALGEVLLGTVASLAAVIQIEGWTVDVALIVLGGVGLAFGMWWVYFLVPAGDVLHRRRHRSFAWGYGHIFIYASIAAVGAGLHVAALYVEHQATIGRTAVMASIAVPVAIYFIALGWVFSNLVGVRAHTLSLTLAKLSIVALSVVLAASGVALSVCIVVIALAPAVGIIAEERRGRWFGSVELVQISEVDE
jgi:low temperature requirement protein LtrA